MTGTAENDSINFNADQDSEVMRNEVLGQGSNSGENRSVHSRHFTFHKNNSFPQFHINNDPLRKNPITLENTELAPSKRLLPPVQTADAKRFRAFDDVTSPSIEREISESLADTEANLSSSNIDSLSSSNSTQELSNSIEHNSGNSLDERFFQAMRFEKLSGTSPTHSTLSLPIPSIATEWSPRDDDAKSIASDSDTVKHSGSSKRLSIKVLMKLQEKEHQSYSKDEDIARIDTNDNGDDGLQFFPIGNELEHHNDSVSLDSIQDFPPKALSQNKDGDIAKLPYTQSSGILPAIPSHKTRERSYLVGGLTKHGSLLGVDELRRYFPNRILKVFVGTWNMQRRGIPKNLDDFILPKKQEYLQDIYVIGVQESTQDQKMWEIKLQETLGVNHVLAHSVSHGVLHLSIFVRRDLIWFCSSFEDDKVTTRMVSQVKTKGAVAIGFQFFGTSLLFVNAHFHSGETREKERIDDFNKIKEKLKLPRTDGVDTYKSSDLTARYDCVFWFGDLNFRVNLPPSIMQEEVDAPGAMNVKEVLKGDQLHAAMKRKSAFDGFTEHHITFRPTYKLLPGSDSYAVSPKMRTPSYTDRILFKCKDKNSISCSEYDSVTTLKKSDHRPVHGFFEVCLKPGRDNISFGLGKFRSDVYEKAARLRANGGDYQNSSSVCNIL